MSEYRVLAEMILGVPVKPAPLVPPDPWSNERRRTFCGDMTEEQDQELAARLGFDPDVWERLRHDQRVARMKVYCQNQGLIPSPSVPPGKEKPPEADTTDWPHQAKVARGMGTNKTQVGRLIKAGKLRTNGKAGRECRVDPASLLAYCDAEGIAYNET